MDAIEKRELADKCENMFASMCKRRNKIRNCLRPLCCGYCSSNTDCESVCTPIKEEEKNRG